MTVEISDKFPKCNEKIMQAIINNTPLMNNSYDFLAFDAKEVGMSFEPRIEVDYAVYSNREIKGVFSNTLVFEKNYDFVTNVNSHWIKKLN